MNLTCLKKPLSESLSPKKVNLVICALLVAELIKNKNINQYYIYSLKRTPLELILDKDYLISQIKNLEARIVNDKYLNFTLVKDNNKIHLFRYINEDGDIVSIICRPTDFLK